MRFAWALDDDWRTVVATVRKPSKTVRVELEGRVTRAAGQRARSDVERILSLDVDGSGYAALGRKDKVVRELQRRFPGLRPVLFYTPYESAAWSIIGHRIRMTQAATIKQRLAEELGERGAFPAPAVLATLTSPQRGLTDQKIMQLRGIGEAARAGRLSRDRLRELSPGDTAQELQELPGIGPFSAELIRIRGVGDPDALPQLEQRLARAMGAAYDLPDDADLDPIAERWRPYRAWIALLLRAWLEAETSEIAAGRRNDKTPQLDTKGTQ